MIVDYVRIVGHWPHAGQMICKDAPFAALKMPRIDRGLSPLGSLERLLLAQSGHSAKRSSLPSARGASAQTPRERARSTFGYSVELGERGSSSPMIARTSRSRRSSIIRVQHVRRKQSAGPSLLGFDHKASHRPQDTLRIPQSRGDSERFHQGTARVSRCLPIMWA
jgi:hypothetical protein